MRIAILGLVPLALLVGCGSGVDPEATVETVRATEQAQIEAIANRDLRGAVRNYHDDAIVVLPNGAATGTAAIGQAFERLLADPNLKLEVAPQNAWAAESGELAVTISRGQLTSTAADGGAAMTVPIDSQTVWRRTSGQPWKIASEYIVERPSS